MNAKTRNEVISTLRKMKREDLVPHIQKTVTAQQESYDWMHKAVAASKEMVKAIIKENRQDEIADSLAAIIKTAVPQSLQGTVMKKLRSHL